MKFSIIEPYLENLTSLAQEAAVEAGHYIQSQLDSHLNIAYKQNMGSLASSIVTEVDGIAQSIILKQLSQASDRCNGLEFGLLAEESVDNRSRLDCDYFWAVDPLDGTLAFTQGTSGYSVCIALVHQSGEVVMGVVYDPREQIIYQAIKSQGATKIKSEQTSLYLKTLRGKKNLTVLFDQSQTQVNDFDSRWTQFITLAQNAGFEKVRYLSLIHI